MKIEFTIFRDLLYIFVGNTKSTLDFFVERRLDERKKHASVERNGSPKVSLNQIRPLRSQE